MQGRTLPLAAILCLAASPATAWEQLHGGPQRDGIFRGPETLDVYETEILAREGMSLEQGPGVVITEEEILWIDSNGTAPNCRLFRRPTSGPAAPTITHLEGCRDGVLIGYDEPRRSLLLCSPGPADAHVLQSRNASNGVLQWAVTPRLEFGLNSTAAETWTCGGAALDLAAGEIAVPFVGWQPLQRRFYFDRPVAHRLTLVSLESGQILWQKSVPDSEFFDYVTAGVTSDGPTVADGFEPRFASLSRSGAIFSGLFHCNHQCPYASYVPAPTEAAYAWLSRSGDLSRGLRATRLLSSEPLSDPWPVMTMGSRWPVLNGSTFFVATGGYLVSGRLEATELSVLPLADLDFQSRRAVLAEPRRLGGLFVVPFIHTIAAFQALHLANVWRWDAGDWFIEDIAANGAGDLWVLVSHGWAPPYSYKVVRISQNGGLVQELPLLPKLQAVTTPTLRGMFAGATSSDVFILGRGGDMTRLGPARGSAWLDVSTDRAVVAPNETLPLQLRSRLPEVPPRFMVNWGDGTIEYTDGKVPPQHKYARSGEYLILASASFKNGTTATSELGITVGQASAVPGVEPSFLADAPMVFLYLGLGGFAAASTVWGGVHLRARRNGKEGRGPQAPMPQAGEVFLRKYAVDRRLGQGSFGQAWLAHDHTNGRRVVIKQLHPDLANNPAARARMEREARILAGLDHPRITRLLGVERAASSLFLVTEYVEGGSLEALVSKGPLPVHEAVRIAEGCLEALAHVHARGILHRDVKPSNILLTPDGQPVLADFGVATGNPGKETVGLTVGATPVGTPLYMAPERLRGEPEHASSDLYSVGATFLNAITGKPPLGTAAQEEADRRLRHSPPLRVWLEKAMALEASERFASAQEMLEALRLAKTRNPVTP